MDSADVAVTNTDNDTAGITVIPTSGLTTTEGGGTATFTIALATQPTANVTIGLSSSDLTEGTVAPASLTFTPANWNTAQTVTVTGVDDFAVDGNVAYTIVTAAATSTDASYDGHTPADHAATNIDNDIALDKEIPTSRLTTREGGGSATFTIALATQPTAIFFFNDTATTEIYTLSLHDALPISPANWNTAQTVTVTGVDDFAVDGNVAYTIVTAAATSTDGVSNGLKTADAGVTNTENDTAGITVTPTSGLTTTEGGGTATVSIAL